LNGLLFYLDASLNLGYYIFIYSFTHVTFNFVFVFDYTLSIFISFFYSSSFFWMSKRTKQENSRGWKNLNAARRKQ